MKKRRITLNLDEDLVVTLETLEGRSMSDVANRLLRDAAESYLHRHALVALLDELDRAHGAPTIAEYARADRVLDDVFGSKASASVA